MKEALRKELEAQVAYAEFIKAGTLTAASFAALLAKLLAHYGIESQLPDGFADAEFAALGGDMSYESVVLCYNKLVDTINAAAGGSGGAAAAATEPAVYSDALWAALREVTAENMEEKLDDIEALLTEDTAASASDGTPVLCFVAALPAADGKVDLIGMVLSKGAAVDCTEGSGKTALIIAVAAEDVEAVEALLEAGADKDIRDSEGKTAAEYANGNEEIEEHLSGSGMGEMPSLGPNTMTAGGKVNRRTSVSAEGLNPSNMDENVTTPVYQKDEEGRARIKAAISKNFLFSSMDSKQEGALIDAMQEDKVEPGVEIITQGDRQADFFYVIDSGEAEVWKAKAGEDAVKLTTKDGQDIKLKAGYSFGELALMYSTPRAATIKSATEMVLWKLDRDTFRQIVLKSTMMKRQKYESFLEKVPLLESMDSYERATVADGLKEEKFPEGTDVIAEGEVGDKFYVVVEGQAKAIKNGEAVQEYTEGSYFGELALLKDEPRAATVQATTDLVCVYLDRAAFERLMGPVVSILKRNADNYEKFAS